ncbi:MAG: methyltransferase domain-containing protein, partial [Myxococcales bacterium]|nr:methyltransferase domain-containing protein [Myxococcales bacterium]
MSNQESRGAARLRDRRVARVVDREIAPVWHDRFARLIIRNLPPITGLFALDIHCGPGRLTSEILQRTDPRSRVLAIEPDDTLLSLAKSRIKPEWRRRVYHKPGNFDDITTMSDATYDLTVANLVLSETHDLSNAFGEMLRITKPGGHVMATLPLSGTWEEAEDIFNEVLRDAGLRAASRRLERFRALRQRPQILAEILRSTGVPDSSFVIEHERLQVLFPSGREFLFAPVIEHGPLRLWKAIIGNDGKPPELFWKLKEAIDTYYAGHVLSVSIVAGLIHIQRPLVGGEPTLAADYWQRYPSLDRLWGGMAQASTSGHGRPLLPFSDADVDEFDLDIDIDFDGSEDHADDGLDAQPDVGLSHGLDAQPDVGLSHGLDAQPDTGFGHDFDAPSDPGFGAQPDHDLAHRIDARHDFGAPEEPARVFSHDNAMRATELPPQPDAFDEDMVTRPREVEPKAPPHAFVDDDEFDPLAGTFLPDAGHATEPEPLPEPELPEPEPEPLPEPEPEPE